MFQSLDVGKRLQTEGELKSMYNPCFLSFVGKNFHFETSKAISTQKNPSQLCIQKKTKKDRGNGMSQFKYCEGIQY